MFRAIRIGLLLFVLLFVSLNAWLTHARSTDWNDSLWVRVYPINADGSKASRRYIESLDVSDFEPVESFMSRAVSLYGKEMRRPVTMKLGGTIHEQPPALDSGAASRLDVLLWSLKMRWWAARVTGDDDGIRPDVRIFMRFFSPERHLSLENSVGVKKGKYGIVNAYAGRLYRGRNNVIIAHELLHTLGASDKYDPATGHPLAPDGLADPAQEPLYPQRHAEIMGGRVALAADDSVIPGSLDYAVMGPLTASEIGLLPRR